MATDDDGPEIGLTGARFGGARRRRRSPAPAAEPAVEPDEPPQPVPGARPTGARFGGPRSSPEPAPLAEPPPPPPPAAPPVVEWPLTQQPGPEIAAVVRVRPYVITGGRTRTDVHLELETLVSAGPAAPRDHAAVVELCRTPCSVAEVAARTGLPLGVAKVVVGDLAEQGALVVHDARDVADLAFLERVLAGLRRL